VMGHRMPSAHLPFTGGRGKSHVRRVSNARGRMPAGPDSLKTGQKKKPNDKHGANDYAGEMVEAAEQSRLQPAAPYWPYRIGQLEFESDSLAPAERDLKAALARDADYVPA